MQSFLINLRWIVTGVYAPELVVFTAWRQWSSAKMLGDLVRNRQEKGYNRARRHDWTMTHNIFASTGGFVFELEDVDSNRSRPFLPLGCPRRLALTA